MRDTRAAVRTLREEMPEEYATRQVVAPRAERG